jgi:hypothetical protein
VVTTVAGDAWSSTTTLAPATGTFPAALTTPKTVYVAPGTGLEAAGPDEGTWLGAVGIKAL